MGTVVIKLVETAFLMSLTEMLLPESGLTRCALRVMAAVRTVTVIEPLVFFLLGRGVA